VGDVLVAFFLVDLGVAGVPVSLSSSSSDIRTFFLRFEIDGFVDDEVVVVLKGGLSRVRNSVQIRHTLAFLAVL
jgi:hypothetical protein